MHHLKLHGSLRKDLFFRILAIFCDLGIGGIQAESRLIVDLEFVGTFFNGRIEVLLKSDSRLQRELLHELLGVLLTIVVD